MPELVFVAGCNAAGKSTFIRTRLNELEDFEVLMTDVYKGRTKDLADYAHNAGYQTSLVVLFPDSIQQSITRVALRGVQQSGLTISGNNIESGPGYGLNEEAVRVVKKSTSKK